MKRKTKKINRVTSMMLVIAMAFCLIACGNATPVIGEDVVSIEESSIEENSKAVEEPSGEDDTEGAKEEAENNDDEVTGANGEEEPVVTASPEPTAEPTPIPTAEPTPTPHVHQYAESITTQATCATAGVKTLTCECGDSKTEQIPATGQHNWVEGTNVIHHEGLGHVEVTEVQVQVGTEMRQEYECANCGARFNTPEEKVEHCKATGDFNHATSRTIIHDIPGSPIYETQTQSQWIVDQEPWDEVVGTGTYTCTVCGATK